MKSYKNLLGVLAIIILIVVPISLFFLKSSRPTLEAKLSAFPTTIKAAGDETSTILFRTAERAVLKVSYSNNSNKKLTGVKIWISVDKQLALYKDVMFGSTPTKTSYVDHKESTFDTVVIDVPDLDPGESGEVKGFLISKHPKSIIVKAGIKSQEGGYALSNSVTVTSN